MRGIAEWLASIGLVEYGQLFTENAIDLSVVRDLTDQDLRTSASCWDIAARCCAPSRSLMEPLLHRP